jgi:hypothetical protein
MDQISARLVAFRDSPAFWDIITLGCLMLCVLGFLVFLVWLLGLPGRIAVSRNHPDAEAVYAMGWVGFLAIVPWIQALIWAFKPTDKVDIRRFPLEERLAEEEDLERLSRYAYGRGLSDEARAKLRRQPPAAEIALASGVAPGPAADSQDTTVASGTGPGPTTGQGSDERKS